MDQVAQRRTGASAAVRHADLVGLAVVERVGLLNPDAQQPAQRAGEAAQEAEVVAVDAAGAAGGDQRAALLDERFQLLGDAGLDHVQHRGGDQRIAGEVGAFVDDVDVHAAALQRAIVLKRRVLIVHLAPRPLAVAERPAVVPIEDQRCARRRGGAEHAGQSGQYPADLGDVAERPRVLMPGVADDCAVEFFPSAAALPPLEVLHRVRAVRDGV